MVTSSSKDRRLASLCNSGVDHVIVLARWISRGWSWVAVSDVRLDFRWMVYHVIAFQSAAALSGPNAGRRACHCMLVASALASALLLALKASASAPIATAYHDQGSVLHVCRLSWRI